MIFNFISNGEEDIFSEPYKTCGLLIMKYRMKIYESHPNKKIILNMTELKLKYYTMFLLLILSAYSLPAFSQQTNFQKVRSGFENLSDDNTVWCYWYWIGDDISKDGITKDLEAMKNAGIGGALIGNINPDEKDGKVPILSEDWWGHMVHAINEGKRLGVNIGVFNAPGWSQSGGPWIKPEMAMRHIVYSEVAVTGKKHVNVNLPKPAKLFQDVYVLATPSKKSKQKSAFKGNAKISVSPPIINAINLIDKDTATSANFSKTDYQVDIIANNDMNARSIRLLPGKGPINVACEIAANIDGKFKTVKSFVIDRSRLEPAIGPNIYAPVSISLPSIKAKEFRIKFHYIGVGWGMGENEETSKQTWGFSEIEISESPVLENYAEKNLGKLHPTPLPLWDSYRWESQPEVEQASVIGVDDVIDISDKMDKNGNLSWKAPKGDWIIQRYGMMPTGTKNSPAAPQGVGYEVDKANAALVRFHYSQFIGELLKRIPEESKSAFKYVVADSYEMGSENWTDGYEAKFESEFGYNPKKYLPVFSGKIVGSVEESNRFLWDLRRSIATAVAYEYTGELRKSSNKDNLQLWLENYGHWGFPSEFLMYGGQSDLVSGEFWNEGTLGDIECKSASSAAHIYGKPMVSAEAFTASSRTYVRHPAMLKKRGDWSFTEGINHFVLHLYVHQPDDKRVPGVNAWFSTEFNRHNTWFEKSRAYLDYLRRSQHLLQQGTYAADVCYFIGEDAPIMTGARNPELPKGYSYDYINAEVILNRLNVKNGKFILPDGMTYSMMVLPPMKTMTPELLKKIESLVTAGGIIYGQAPTKSPSLKNYPESDKHVRELAAKMWGSSNDQIKKYGNGFIVDGLDLQDAMNQLGIAKDVNLNSDVPVLWTHRKLENMDIYFLTNQSEQEIQFAPSFKVQGMKPQLWDAVTGEIRPLNEFKESNGTTTVSIKMKSLESWFVVFSSSDLNIADKNSSSNFPESKTVTILDNAWTVDFKNKEIGPKEVVEFPKLTDWINNTNDRIKYYSGTAVYTSTFNYKKQDGTGNVFVDLGKVGVMATVKINGKNIGTTWIAPFKLKANEVIKEGKNTIEIEVVNVWRNRLTGDKLLPEKDRTTWLLFDAVTKEEELVPSGLLGPVTIEVDNR